MSFKVKFQKLVDRQKDLWFIAHILFDAEDEPLPWSYVISRDLDDLIHQVHQAFGFDPEGLPRTPEQVEDRLTFALDSDDCPLRGFPVGEWLPIQLFDILNGAEKAVMKRVMFLFPEQYGSDSSGKVREYLRMYESIQPTRTFGCRHCSHFILLPLTGDDV